MISYDSYKNRIEKVAKFKKFVFKFKFLFIGIFVLIVGTIAGLLAAKGSISGATKLSAAEIYYGEEYEVTPAGAFMSKTSVEYAAAGSSEWSQEKPVKAGKYVARTVSKKTVGHGHGGAAEFEIKPVEAQFVIGADSVVYGNTPDGCSVQGLKLGDSLDRSSLKFIYDDYTAAETNVTVDKSALKIVNGGDDRSGCYVLTAEPKAMNIRERAVILSPEAQSVVYSGKAVALSQNVTTGSVALAEGDRATFATTVKNGAGETLASAVDAGSYTLELADIRIYKGETEVTARYSIATRSALLQVAQKQLTVTTESNRRTFDGTPFTHKEFNSEGLNEGHVISASNFASVVNAVTVENTADFVVLDGTGADVTRNYLITPVYGQLTVDRYKVSVTTQDAEKTYDGIALSENRYINTSAMLAGYGLKVSFTPEITDAGTADNALDLSVTDAGGVDSSDNFEIEYTYGKLKITPRPVTVRVKGGEKVYDASPLAVFDCMAEGGTSLVDGHSFAIGAQFSVTDAGETDNNVGVLVSDGYTDKTANYALTFVREKLKVTPRPIHVATVTSSRVYNAQPYSDAGYITSYGAEAGLLNGDELTVASSASRTETGSFQNVCTYRVPNGNYTIADTQYGTLTVTPRPITVRTATSGHVYDAQTYSDASYTTSYGAEAGLLNGDELLPVNVVALTEVGSIDNACTYQAPESGNYTIAGYEYGILSVTPRPITVVTFDAEQIYDGTPLSRTDYDTYYYGDESKEGLLNGETLTLVSTAMLTEANSTNNACRYNVPNGNYEIMGYDEGTLTVTPRPILVVTFGAEQIYNAEPLINTDYRTEYFGDASKAGLLNGDTLECVKIAEITDVGSVQNNCEYQASSNYRIMRSDYGMLTVTPRPITVITATDGKIYDATRLVNTGYETHYFGDETKAGLLNGDELTVDSYTHITDFGIKPNICNYSVPKGVYKNDNYQIKEYVNGTLEITARPLTVYTADDTKIYDSTPLSKTDGYITKYIDGAGAEHEGLLGGDVLTLVTAAQITDAGIVKNDSRYAVPNQNYEIARYEDGNLSVLARRLLVTTATDTQIYDGTALANQGYTTRVFVEKELESCYRDGTDTGLFGDDKLTGIVSVSITDAGTIDNEFTEWNVPIGIYGNQNYVVFEWSYGALTVTPRPILVTTAGGEWIFDGKAHSKPEFAASYFGDATKVGLIAEGDITVDTYAEITDAGNVENACAYNVLVGIYGNENYEIKDYANGTLKVTPRPITVITATDSKIYDATPLVNAGYDTHYYGDETQAGLLNGDALSAVRSAEITDFGTAENVCAYSVPKGVYGNDNYEIKEFVYGTLKIEARPLTVYTASDTKYYDSAPLSNAGYSTKYIDGAGAEHDGLLNGDELAFVGGTDITDAGNVGNACTFTVPNANYIIKDYVEGTLTILPRPLIVVTSDASWVYDAETHFDNRILETKFDPDSDNEYHRDGSNEGLLNGDKIVVWSDWTVITDAGSIPNKFDTCACQAADGAWTSNYEIIWANCEWGTLTVTPRPLLVATNDASKPYNGTPLLDVRYTATYYVDETEAGLLNGAILTTLTHTEITDKSTAENECTYSCPDGVYGNPNYEIKEYKYGTLEVTARPIAVEVLERAIIYGQESYPDEFGNFKNAAACDLAEGERLKIAVRFYQSAGDGFTEVTPKNAGGYLIRLDLAGCVIERNGAVKESGIDNYEVTPTDGGLVVNPKPITVTAHSASIVYGNDYAYPAGAGNFANAASCGLEYGESLEIFVEVAATDGRRWRNVGDYAVTPLADNTLVNGARAGVTNYAITCESGTLTVTPRALIISPKDVDAVYGDAIAYPTGTDNYRLWRDTALAEGDTLELVSTTISEFGTNPLSWSWSDPIEVGVYIILIDENGILINGASDLSNYNISADTYNTAHLTITERHVTIEPYDIADITYGEEFVYPDNNTIGNFKNAATADMAYGEQLALGVTFTPTGNVDAARGVEYVAEFAFALFDKDGNQTDERQRNYNFDSGSPVYVYRKQAEVTLTVPDDECVYGEVEGLFGKEYTVSVDIGNGETEDITFTVAYLQDGNVATPKYAGEYQMTLASIVAPADFADRYVFIPENGTLTVKPRDITVVFHDISVYYGDTEFYPAGYNNFANADTCGLQYGEMLEVNIDSYYDVSSEHHIGVTPKNAGKYSRVAWGWHYSDETGNRLDTADNLFLLKNYNVEFEGGLLTVLPKPITVQANDSQTDYGEPFLLTRSVSDMAYGESMSVSLRCQKDGAKVTPRNAGKYDIVPLPETATVDGGKEGLKNYDIKYVNGTLTVNKRLIALRPLDMTLTYGEELVYDGSYTIEVVGKSYYDCLAYDDTVEIRALDVLKDFEEIDREKIPVGSYSIRASWERVYDEYIHIFVNGEPHRFVEASSLEVNYSFAFEYANLIVNPRPIAIELSEVENSGCTYGDAFAYPTGVNNFVNYRTVDAAYNETFEIVAAYRNAAGETVEAKNAGAYTVLYDTMTVYDEAGNVIENGADNYEVTVVNTVTANIERMNIFITIGHTVAYYGDIARGEGYPVDCTVEPQNLPYGEALHGQLGCRRDGVEAFPGDVGDYDVYFREGSMYITVPDGENEVVAENGLDNYNIDINTENGKFTVLPRPITIVTESCDRVYDGTPLSSAGYTTYFKRTDKDGNEVEDEGLVYGEELTVDIFSWQSITDAGSVQNSFAYELPSANYVLQEELFGTLTVNKRALSVTTNSATKVYDGAALSDAGYTAIYYNENGEAEEGLLNGDALTVDFLREIVNAGSHENDCVYGLPSDNYEFAGDIVYGTLTVEQREIYLSTTDESKEYDGTPLTASGEYTAYHLNAEGERVKALVLNHEFRMKDAVVEITDVGSVDNLSVAGIYNPLAPEEDVESNYIIVPESVGKLTVTPRPIIVETHSKTREYNGTLLTETGYDTYYLHDETKTGLLFGEVLTPIDEMISGITQVGVMANATEFTVPDGANGEPNYVIDEYRYGTLEVTPRPLTVELFDMSGTNGVLYGDGNYPSSDNNFVNYETCNLVAGERLMLAVKYYAEDGAETEAKNVGRYRIGLDIENSVLYSVEGRVYRADNYAIECDGGVLDILPRPLTVRANEYVNGIYYGDGFAYPDVEGNFRRDLPDSALQYEEELKIYVDIVGVADKNGVVAVYPNAGSYALVADQSKTLLNGGREGLSNYDITYEDGELKISPRPLTVFTPTATHVYDGQEFSDTEHYTAQFYNNPNKIGLLAGDTLVLDENNSITRVKNVGEYENFCNYTANSNYEILEYVNGTLTVLPCAITVVLSEVNGTVYGDRLTYPAGAGNFENADTCGLKNGETLEIGVEYLLNGASALPKNAGDYTIRLDKENCTVYAADGEAIEGGVGNYEITCADRTATIARRVVEISLADMPETVYDGEEHAYPSNGYRVAGGSFAYGEQLQIAMLYYGDAERTQACGIPKDAQSYYMAFDARNSFAGGVRVTVNYDIVCNSYPTYVISPMALTLTMNDMTSVYDGKEYNVNSAKPAEFRVEGLIGADRLDRVVEYSSRPLNAGEYTVTYNPASFKINNGLTSNYYLDEEHSKLSCKLNIVKRSIVVTVNSREIEHTGNPVDVKDESFTSAFTYTGGQGFVGGDEQRVQATYTYDGSAVAPAAIGQYAVGVAFADDEVTANYEITYQDGTLTITGRIVIVKPVYTGEPYVYNGEAVDLSLFTFEHRHAGDNLAEDDRYGFLEEDLSGVGAVFTFEGVDRLTDGDTPVHADWYTVSVRLAGYDSVNYVVRYETVIFEIRQRPIQVTVGNLTEAYTNGAPTGVPSFTASGFLPQDEGAYEFEPVYKTTDAQTIKHFDAGEYNIVARLQDREQYNDYVIEQCGVGTLTVTPIAIYVRPTPKSEPYLGQNIILDGDTDFEIFGGALAGNDRLRVTEYSDGGMLQASDKSLRNVSVVSVEILHADGDDALGNYIVYTYDHPDNDSDIPRSDYRATLEFAQRRVYYYLHLPAGQEEFVYDGMPHTLNWRDLNALVSVAPSSEGGDQLLQGHRLVGTELRGGTLVGTYEDWLKIDIVDADGNSVKRGYDLYCANAAESAFHIVPAPVTIEFDASVTDESIADGSVLKTSFDGWNDLDPAKFTVSGLADDMAAEIVVLKSEDGVRLAVFIYQPNYDEDGNLIGRRRDRYDCYEIQSELPDGLNATIGLEQTDILIRE